jgi:hypothetical protein
MPTWKQLQAEQALERQARLGTVAGANKAYNGALTNKIHKLQAINKKRKVCDCVLGGVYVSF